ncbi:DUF1517 domain-containing protein [Leptolyngbya ohadii]|uniref:DUF1517 domain-containing protein n=1 Tax=Leptolyngbya ohadii TaxID=1962290 RepID=UPI000B59E88E|nr:DUF1517 domain-containing protein [Leptolyngbya ohadii]
MLNTLFNKLFAVIKPALKPFLIASLMIALVFSHADGALAASGGRVGGGSFRAPTRTAPAPSRPYGGGGYGGYGGGGGYYPGGGGFGFPFIVPFFGFGGGGLFSIILFIAIAGFLARAFRGATQGGSDGYGYSDGYDTTSVTVAKVQVGLLAQARDLQVDLNRIATNADTGSSEGLTQVLQESTLALLRHPEFWVYASSNAQQASLQAAENKFNQLSLAERSKFAEETLSNVNRQLRQATLRQQLPEAGGSLDMVRDPGEYIVATILVATVGRLPLPTINTTQDLRQALSVLGSVSSDRLLALEVLWTPQAEGDTLSSDEMIAEYPDLKRI